jgi:sterol desaturase/sphingolipid hydroxylase (fatty acid hydroxylase superfamily)
LESLVNFLLFFTLLSIVVLTVGVIERLPAFRFRALPLRRPYLGTDISWFLVAGAASALSAYLFRPLLSSLALDPVAQWITALPAPARLLLAVVIFDFISFAVHLALHRSDTLWNLHKVHHSSLELDSLATTRAHMLENFVRFLTPQAVLFVIGMPVEQVVPTVALYAIYGVFNHSNLGVDLRWAEAVFITPRMHRRHHIPATSQNNFGTIFSTWDRLFGRLCTVETGPEERFGVPGELDSYPQRFIPAVRQPLTQIRKMRADQVEAREAATREPANATERIGAN